MKYDRSQKAALRHKAMDELLMSGWWPADVAAAFNVSASTVYQRTKALREQGHYTSKTNMDAIHTLNIAS